MISSKNHRIVSIFCFKDALETFDFFEKNVEKEPLWETAIGRVDVVVPAKYPLQFIGGKDTNIAWFVACGFLPYSNMVKISYLPTIDHSNHREYLFLDNFYSCPSGKYENFLFDSTIDGAVCPNCGADHTIDTEDFTDSSLLRLNYLWLNFPLFKNMGEMAEDFVNIMKEINAINYPLKRIKYVGV